MYPTQASLLLITYFTQISTLQNVILLWRVLLLDVLPKPRTFCVFVLFYYRLAWVQNSRIYTLGGEYPTSHLPISLTEWGIRRVICVQMTLSKLRVWLLVHWWGECDDCGIQYVMYQHFIECELFLPCPLWWCMDAIHRELHLTPHNSRKY